MPSLPRPLRRGTRSRALDATRPPEPDTPNLEILEAEGLRWINIVRPRPSDRAWLEEHFAFHALDYEDVFSRNQRPKVDEYDDYLFVVLHFPRYDKTIGRLNAAELDVFIGPDFVITLPNEALQPLQYLWNRCSSQMDLRESLFSKGAGYLLYKIVDDCVDASFPMLAKMGNKLERIEDDIFEGRSAEIVRDISDVKQEIINFRKIVRPQRGALKDLERHKRYVSEDLEVYFDDINDASERVWDMLENFKEVVEGLESTNESVLSHRVNDVLRVLTAFSVIILPLTLIASIFGMNVKVPGESSLTAFWIIIGVMVAVLVGMVGYFRKRGFSKRLSSRARASARCSRPRSARASGRPAPPWRRARRAAPTPTGAAEPGVRPPSERNMSRRLWPAGAGAGGGSAVGSVLSANAAQPPGRSTRPISIT
jgi:magnesium transporter